MPNKMSILLRFWQLKKSLNFKWSCLKTSIIAYWCRLFIQWKYNVKSFFHQILEIKICNSPDYVASENSRLHQASDGSRDKQRGRPIADLAQTKHRTQQFTITENLPTTLLSLRGIMQLRPLSFRPLLFRPLAFGPLPIWPMTTWTSFHIDLFQ